MPTSRHVVYRTLSQVWFKYQMFVWWDRRAGIQRSGSGRRVETLNHSF